MKKKICIKIYCVTHTTPFRKKGLVGNCEKLFVGNCEKCNLSWFWYESCIFLCILVNFYAKYKEIRKVITKSNFFRHDATLLYQTKEKH